MKHLSITSLALACILCFQVPAAGNTKDITTSLAGGRRNFVDHEYGDDVVSSIKSNSREKIVHSFGNSSDGAGPFAGLTAIKNTFYGTTISGGTPGSYGTVFSIDPSTGTETILHSFGGGTDGADPEAVLIAVKGVLFGTTRSGGAFGGGTVFSIDPGTGIEIVLHSATQMTWTLRAS